MYVLRHSENISFLEDTFFCSTFASLTSAMSSTASAVDLEIVCEHILRDLFLPC